MKGKGDGEAEKKGSTPKTVKKAKGKPRMDEVETEQIVIPSVGWSAPICLKAQKMSGICTGLLETKGWEFEKSDSIKNFQQIVAVISFPKFSYVFRFEVKAPQEMYIDFYDTQPTHAAELHFIELTYPVDANMDLIHRFLHDLVEVMPRKPWEFYLRERFRYGFAVPEFLRAKKIWRIALDGGLPRTMKKWPWKK